MIFQCLADQLLFALALTNHDILLGEKTQYGTLHRAYITGALVTLWHALHVSTPYSRAT